MDYETRQEQKLEEMHRLLNEKQLKALRQHLEDSDAFDVSEFLTELEPQQMIKVFRVLSKEHGAEVFAELDVPEQEYIINSVTDAELGNILEELYLDDTVDLMEELPANVVARVMRISTPETRKLINQYLKYPENSAGSIMTAEFIDLKKYMSVKESFARIKRIGADKETVYTCFVTSADRKLEGVVTVKDLIMANDFDIIEDIMNDVVIYATTEDDQEDVSNMFSDYNLLTIPVVDTERRLVGIVTVDDVMDVMEQEATEDIEIMAGITPSDKPYSRTPVTEIFKNRLPWLMLLMLSATFTSMILTSFEDALAAQAALIAFIPMLMGTGGNSGSQSSTAVIRSLSIGDTEPRDVLMVLWKEIRVSILCGICLAIVNFGKMFLLDKFILGNNDITVVIALTVSATVLFVVIFAKIVGCTLPMLAERIGIDPAVMASPLITTLTDAVSLIIYFTIARMLLGT
ncbi:MAG: magnesium transporter [Oscillospiraceae bacterium]|nr:magnesium transporter [Oscillospiraceae bacterium]